MSDIDPETLRQQLEILNERSRWYSAELWQIPFAYLGLTGIVIAQMVTEEKAQVYLPFAYILSGIFGLFVLCHMVRVRNHEQAAVKKLRDIECKLGFKEEEKAVSGKGWHIFQYAVLFFVLLYFLLALGYWCGCAA